MKVVGGVSGERNGVQTSFPLRKGRKEIVKVLNVDKLLVVICVRL